MECWEALHFVLITSIEISLQLQSRSVEGLPELKGDAELDQLRRLGQHRRDLALNSVSQKFEIELKVKNSCIGFGTKPIAASDPAAPKNLPKKEHIPSVTIFGTDGSTVESA